MGASSPASPAFGPALIESPMCAAALVVIAAFSADACGAASPFDPTEQIPIGPASLADITLEPCLVPPIRRYQSRVMRLIAEGKLDPTPLLSQRMPLSEAPQAYKMMAERLDGAIKIVIKP